MAEKSIGKKKVVKKERKIVTLFKDYGNIVIFVLVFIMFFKTCSTSNKVKELEENSVTKTEFVERITTLNESTATKDEIRDEMEQVMFEFLIYEDDLDKGKITKSQIKQRIGKNK